MIISKSANAVDACSTTGSSRKPIPNAAGCGHKSEVHSPILKFKPQAEISIVEQRLARIAAADSEISNN